MKLFWFVAILLCGKVGLTIGSTLKPSYDPNMEDSTLHYLQQEMITMKNRLILLETRESADIVQKVKNEVLLEVQKAEVRFHDGKQELAKKVTEIESALTSKQNDLSNKLDEIEQKSSKQKEEILHTLSEVENAFKLSLYDVTERLLNEKNKFLLMDNHLLMEVHDLQKKTFETSEKMTNVQNDLKSAFEKSEIKTNFLQMKLNETSDCCLASQKNTEVDFQKNMSSSFEKLRVHVNEGLLLQLEDVRSDLRAEMRNLESSLQTLRTECANVSFVSSLYNDVTAKMQSMGAEHIEDFQALRNTVTNHTSQIKLLRVEFVCNPPCENEGKCVENNVCNCPPAFNGHRCQNAVCSPPCENGGKCMKNNICNCSYLFSGDRCNDEPQCGLDYNSFDRTLVFPWMAALYYDYAQSGSSVPQYFCDGSVIHRRFILTSVIYCIKEKILDKVIVKLGLTDLKAQTHLQEYKVRAIHIHPLYSSFDHDIALLELQKPIEYNNFVRPVCLPPAVIPTGSPFYKSQTFARAITLKEYINATSSASQNISPNSLRNVNIIIQSPYTTAAKISQKQWTPYYPSSNRLFWADIRDNASTACHLMAGTPVMQSLPNKVGTLTWTLVGATILRCYDTGDYLIASHVHYFMPWINSTIAAT